MDWSLRPKRRAIERIHGLVEKIKISCTFLTPYWHFKWFNTDLLKINELQGYISISRLSCLPIEEDIVLYKSCIPHDLIIAKWAAYGLDNTALKLIFSYLKNRKQCISINNTYRNFENIISGVQQGSAVGPLLFDFTKKTTFLFIGSSSVHNFADDNTLSAWANTISDLISKSDSDSNIAIAWLKMNKRIVNSDKFQAIVLNKKLSVLTNTNFQVDNQVIKL